MNVRIPGRSIAFHELDIKYSTIYKFMGYGENIPDEETLSIVDVLLKLAAKITKPMFYFQLYPCKILPDSLIVGDIHFETGELIARIMRHSEQIAVFVATAGLEYQSLAEQIYSEGDSLRSFVLDAIGNTIIEAHFDYLESELEKNLSTTKHTTRLSPGYCDWNVMEQKKLFSLLPPHICGITLNDSSLMYPIKSISGFIGVGYHVITKHYGCSICKKKDCILREQAL
ncbi:MAG: vitamin B12 dependent-methionine synthase activation domain-containing protein [Bacteroidaceae bacterium]